MTGHAPDQVRDAARRAYIDHEGYGTREGHNAAADVAYTAGVTAGRRQAADAIRAAGGAYEDVRRQCANLAEHGTVNDPSEGTCIQCGLPVIQSDGRRWRHKWTALAACPNGTTVATPWEG